VNPAAAAAATTLPASSGYAAVLDAGLVRSKDEVMAGA